MLLWTGIDTMEHEVVGPGIVSLKQRRSPQHTWQGLAAALGAAQAVSPELPFSGSAALGKRTLHVAHCFTTSVDLYRRGKVWSGGRQKETGMAKGWVDERA